jgi:shikimate dehydrogenase
VNVTTVQFGLLGYPLTHSFSKKYFESKFLELHLINHQYHNFEVENLNGLKDYLSVFPYLRGFNVTIPHKETILSFCDELSAEAKEIGAVNCVSIENGKWIGHNTDYFGFKQSIKPFLEPSHYRALILGTGGSSKAVAFALKSIGVEVYFVSTQSSLSSEVFNYKDVNEHILNAFKLIVNTTPLGMFPNTHAAPEIPYEYLNATHFCYDLIYNPEETLFLKQAKTQGALSVNGLSMLKLQAEKSWDIWKG